MTAALDAIRALAEAARANGIPWYSEAVLMAERPYPADVAYIAAVSPDVVLALLAALDRAEAVVAALTNELDEARALLLDALEVQRHPCDHKSIGLPGCFVCDPRTYPKPEQMRRAYEDADKEGVQP